MTTSRGGRQVSPPPDSHDHHTKSSGDGGEPGLRAVPPPRDEVPPGFTRATPAEAPVPPLPPVPPHVQAQMDRQAERTAEFAHLLKYDMPKLLASLPRLFGPEVAQIVFEAFTGVLRQAHLARTPVCARCRGVALKWQATYGPELTEARDAVFAEMGGLTLTDPRLADPQVQQAVQAAILARLPEGLRAAALTGPPPVNEQDTVIGGTGLCAMHHPDAPQDTPEVPARGPILISNMPLSAAVVRAAGGVPGVWGGMPVPVP